MSPTLFDKVWNTHVVCTETSDAPAVLYVDLHLIHEVTSAQAFDEIRERGLSVRGPERCLAVADHSIPTDIEQRSSLAAFKDRQAASQVERLHANCAEHGIELHGLDSPEQGIIHVVAPEMGAVHPGMSVVCGDSHTSTHGAFGALAFGIGTSQVAHVLATQCILMRKPKNYEVRIDGTLPQGVSAKDLALFVMSRVGASGGAGHVIEYRGSAVDSLSMEGRMTLCNMSIEAGARAGMIAPDERVYEYLKGRAKAPSDWGRACESWSKLCTDEGASFDTSLVLDASEIEPMITYGTSPDEAIGVTRAIPGARDESQSKALEYMRLDAGKPIAGTSVDVVFIGSCTNSRIGDLRDAAQAIKGRKVSEHTRALVVAGSKRVKEEAEAEGLDKIFVDAGCEWREPGCSMCIAMNGDQLAPGQLAVSTSNRNFAGRQGPGGRTLLASPATAAASAVAGQVVDPRGFSERGV